tara:strand:+ start:2349 stop:2684 length:336 start_codon:yes stop_codon:yes gene_type:complete
MGLEDKFTSGGSLYGAGQGGNSANLQSERDVIIKIKKLSKLHNEYSINDTPNIPGKPSPSDLDLGGVKPKSANKDPKTLSINNTFEDGTYENSLLNSKIIGRVQDLTDGTS